MLHKILSLYPNPSAHIGSNGLLSHPLGIYNGTHKGCPLYPLLYILTIEHLSIAIRNKPTIKEITKGLCQYKLLIYAVDIALYVTTPHSDLLVYMQNMSIDTD